MIPNDSVSTLNLTIVVVAVVINDSVCSNYSFTAYVYGLDIMNCLLKMMWKYPISCATELAKYFENNDDARSLTFLLPLLMEEDFAHEEHHLVVDATHHMEHMETDEVTSGLQKVWGFVISY